MFVIQISLMMPSAFKLYLQVLVTSISTNYTIRAWLTWLSGFQTRTRHFFWSCSWLHQVVFEICSNYTDQRQVMHWPHISVVNETESKYFSWSSRRSLAPPSPSLALPRRSLTSPRRQTAKTILWRDDWIYIVDLQCSYSMSYI